MEMPGDECEIKVVREADPLLLVLSGVLTVETAGKFQQALAEVARAEDHRDVILDLERVVFMDSTALGFLVAAWKRLNAKDRELRLRRPHLAVATILNGTGLNRLFTIEA